MEEIKLRQIDWEKTGYKLKLLRNDNLNLRRYVCWWLSKNQFDDRHLCYDYKCEDCLFEMDQNISQVELGAVMNTGSVANWETGRTPIDVENLMFYCKLCGVEAEDIIVYKD